MVNKIFYYSRINSVEGVDPFPLLSSTDF